MITNVHIVYPEAGIAFSQLKKICATFEEGCKIFLDSDSDLKDGKIMKVESGSIWFEVFLPIAQATLPYFLNFIKTKLCGKKSKITICVESQNHDETIKITVEN